MAFTFDPTLVTELSQLRAEIGDDVLNAGVLPDGANIPDATLLALLASEGSVGLAAARIAEMLSRKWARTASSISIGSRSESYGQSERWLAIALSLRQRYGGGASLRAGVIALDFAAHDDGDTTLLDTD